MGVKNWHRIRTDQPGNRPHQGGPRKTSERVWVGPSRTFLKKVS